MLKQMIIEMLQKTVAVNESWGELGKVIPPAILTKHLSPKAGRYSPVSGVGPNSKWKKVEPKWSAISKTLKDEGGRIVIWSDKDNYIILERIVKRNHFKMEDDIKLGLVAKSFNNPDLKRESSDYKEGTLQKKSLKVLVEDILGTFLGANIPVNVAIIFVDETMKPKQIDRSKAKSGVIPLPSENGYKTYIRHLKTSLETKLADFKAIKAPKANNKEEFLEIVKKDFPEYIMVNGGRYDRADSSVYMFSEGATIEYRASRTESWGNTREDYRQSLIDAGKTSDEIYEILEKVFPYKISVEFKIEGTMLKATDITWGN